MIEEISEIEKGKKVRLWNPKDRVQIKKGKLPVSNTFPDRAVRYVTGTIACQQNGLVDLQFKNMDSLEKITKA